MPRLTHSTSTVLMLTFSMILTLAITVSSQPQSTLDIYWIDVEGGAATLVVTPERDSILMDTGWPRRPR